MYKKNNVITRVAVVLVFGLSVSTFFSAFASTPVYSGSVNFVGAIVDPVCTASFRQTAHLGVLHLAELKNSPGTLAGKRTTFVITLTGCDTRIAKTASVTFSGIHDSANRNILAIEQGANAAQGIGIRLTDKSGTPIKLGIPSAITTLMDGANHLIFNAQYISTSSTLVEGNMIASVSFTITYA